MSEELVLQLIALSPPLIGVLHQIRTCKAVLLSTLCEISFCSWPILTSKQIARRRRAHQEQRPDAKIISLGIGDTTEPIPPRITQAMERAGKGLGSTEGYSGLNSLPGRSFHCHQHTRQQMYTEGSKGCGWVAFQIHHNMLTQKEAMIDGL